MGERYLSCIQGCRNFKDQSTIQELFHQRSTELLLTLPAVSKNRYFLLSKTTQDYFKRAFFYGQGGFKNFPCPPSISCFLGVSRSVCLLSLDLKSHQGLPSVEVLQNKDFSSYSFSAAAEHATFPSEVYEAGWTFRIVGSLTVANSCHSKQDFYSCWSISCKRWYRSRYLI